MGTLPQTLLELALLGYVIGALSSLCCWRAERGANVLAFGIAVLAALSGAIGGFSGLLAGALNAHDSVRILPALIPYLRFSVRLDPLGLFFAMIVSLVGLATALYSLGYNKQFFGRKNVAVFGAFFNALLLATTLVFLADNAFFFLIAWEVMALSAYLLVSFEHEKEESRNAGVLFFVMSHIGTGCLILGFLLLFQASGGYGFEGFHAIGARMAPGARDAAFILFLVGFGVKAGIIPLHIWLPVAHPAAPSNVSAFMSGVLIKTGIYGLVRVCFDFMGPPPNWWGVTLLVLGTVSAVLGVLYALMEHDLKRLLAYHSIENIGIILMGLGASLMFLHSGHPVLAALALIAGLYHTINHAVFKSLLFLGAGAVVHATHTRNMEEMGGLVKRMPQTAFCFLNGFVSEWLTYQSLLKGFGTTPSLIRLLFPLGGAMLALTGALAAACFVKAFGITFLAQPRSEHAAGAHEAGRPEIAAQILLTVVCVVLGLFPAQVLRLLDPVTLQLAGQALSSQLTLANGLVLAGATPAGGTMSTLGLALTAVCLLPALLVFGWVFSRGTTVRRAATWACGQQALTPRMEYTATGFSKPIRMIFKALFRPRREVQREYDFSPYFAKNLRFESHVEEVFQTRIYRPLNWMVWRVSRQMRALQAGSLQAYLIYIFVTLLLLLMFAL
jgi:hydrogenase-4 component B